MKTVLITGASSGIGAACAQTFAAAGFRLILTGRRLHLLQSLANSLGVDTLCLGFDVRDAQATQNALKHLPENWQHIDILINNAGLAAGLSPLHEGEIEDWERMIDTNIKGLLYVTRCIAPKMVTQGFGHIFNISSIAGKEVYANGNVYCATKHAVDALSKALRIELMPHNVKVTNVAPGMVETEFSVVRFAGDTQRAKAVYHGLYALQATDVAEVILFAAQRPAHVCLNDLVIMPTAQATATVIKRN